MCDAWSSTVQYMNLKKSYIREEENLADGLHDVVVEPEGILFLRE